MSTIVEVSKSVGIGTTQEAKPIIRISALFISGLAS